MEIRDLTLNIGKSTPTYLGDPSFKRRLVQSITSNDQADVSLLTMSAHIGTHVDAPSHLIKGGTSVEQLSLSILVGPVFIVQFDGLGPITHSDLEKMGITGSVPRVLFKTRNSEFLDHKQFVKDYVGFTEQAALWLVNQNVKLVGIDYLSVDAPGNVNLPVHRVLLSNGVVVVEGLSLGKTPPGEYTIVCLPMKLEGSEGSPARVILLPPGLGL